jgi:hypothetical protein
MDDLELKFEVRLSRKPHCRGNILSRKIISVSPSLMRAGFPLGDFGEAHLDKGLDWLQSKSWTIHRRSSWSGPLTETVTIVFGRELRGSPLDTYRPIPQQERRAK